MKSLLVPGLITLLPFLLCFSLCYFVWHALAIQFSQRKSWATTPSVSSNIYKIPVSR
ncbi:hypothetical protein [Flavobacterium caeni]|uniref:hypothetical protein n=1 Tax=Flavobacterium caeni TaxID=490189 RepID=UPI001481A552|nr:hypothetical protein [Flavobacterium caeni]